MRYWCGQVFKKLVVNDADSLSVGNLTRHTLGINSLGKRKGTAIANRLKLVSIHSQVEGIDNRFPPKCQKHVDLIHACDVVIDCSGSDSVAHEMACFPWVGPKTFLSISLGLEAQRMFLFVAHGDTFPNQEFRKKIDPWLKLELGGYSSEFPRDGLGCWHPKMPARGDDVWLMAAAAAKLVEESIITPPEAPRLTVFQQKLEHGVFLGLHRVDDSENPV